MLLDIQSEDFSLSHHQRYSPHPIECPPDAFQNKMSQRTRWLDQSTYYITYRYPKCIIQGKFETSKPNFWTFTLSLACVISSQLTEVLMTNKYFLFRTSASPEHYSGNFAVDSFEGAGSLQTSEKKSFPFQQTPSGNLKIVPNQVR